MPNGKVELSASPMGQCPIEYPLSLTRMPSIEIPLTLLKVTFL